MMYAFNDNASVKSDASSVKTTASVIRATGPMGNTTFIEPGTVTVTGIFGTTRIYKEGDCIHGGFFSKTQFVGPAAGTRSPYVTPTTSPDASPADMVTPGDAPPKMALK